MLRLFTKAMLVSFAMISMGFVAGQFLRVAFGIDELVIITMILFGLVMIFYIEKQEEFFISRLKAKYDNEPSDFERMRIADTIPFAMSTLCTIHFMQVGGLIIFSKFLSFQSGTLIVTSVTMGLFLSSMVISFHFIHPIYERVSFRILCHVPNKELEESLK